MPRGGRGTFFAIGLSVGTGLALLFLVWSFPGFRNPTYQQEKYSHSESHETGDKNPVVRPSFWETYTSPTDTYAQWIMAIAAIAATSFSIWAVFLVRGTLNEATMATEAANRGARYQRTGARPFVTPTNSRLRLLIDGGGEVPTVLSFHTDFLNVGGGPAFIKSYGIGHHIGRSPPGDDAPLHAVRQTVGPWFIRPDATRDFGAAFDHIEIKADVVPKLRGCKTNLYVFGHVDYRDSFGAIWRSGFCFEFIPNVQESKTLIVSGNERHWQDHEIENPD